MSLNKVQHQPVLTIPPQEATQTGRPLSYYYEREVPLLHHQSLGVDAASGEVPGPTLKISSEPSKDGDIPLRAAWVSKRIEKLESVMEGRIFDELASLSQTDKKAKGLLERIEKLRPWYDSLKKEDEKFAERRLRPQDSFLDDGITNSERMGSEDDFDGDGIKNRDEWERGGKYWVPEKKPKKTKPKKEVDDKDPPKPDSKPPVKIDIFEGSMPRKEEGDVVTYEIKGRAGTARIPEKVGDKEVKQVYLTKDGEDAIFELKDKGGSLLKRIVLKGGTKSIESHDIKIQLGDNGQLFEGGGFVIGGKGSDYIQDNSQFKTTFHAEGGLGNDTLMAGDENTAEFFGGKGRDILRGGNKASLLDGGDDADLIYANGEGSTVRGGRGDDVIAVQRSTGKYDIDGGEGIDMFSGLGETANVQRVELGPSQATEVEDLLLKMIAKEKGVDLDEAKKALTKAKTGGILSADTVKNTVLSYLNRKTDSNKLNYGIESEGSWTDGFDLGKDGPPKPKDPEDK